MFYSLDNLDLLSVGVVCAGMGLLGFAVLFSNRKSISNKSFFLFTLISIVWGIVNFFSYKLSEPLAALWILRAEIFLGIWHSFSLYLFTLVFPEQQHLFSKKFKFILLPITTAVSILTLTPIMFQNISDFVGSGEVSTVSKGPATLLFILLVIFLMVGSFYNLIKKIRHSKNNEKTQLTTIFYGLILTFFLIATFNFLLPALFDYLYLAPLGALFIFPFIAFTFYAIYKYEFFNLRAAFVAGITFVLSVAAFLEIIFSTSTTLVILRSAVFLLVLAISIMMNRFVETIAKQREALQKANEGQENLIHIMNHQIKGYLGKNKDIFAELLTGDYGSIPEMAKPLITEGFDQSNKGVAYVQDILRGASAQRGTLPYDMKPVDIKPLVLSLASEQKGIAEKKGLSFEVTSAEGDYTTLGDTAQLGEAFKNLITNAIRYNSPQGSIKADLARKEGNIVFSVKDSGVGISDEDKAKIFTAGGIGKNSIKINTDAAGFGLAFVKGVVEAHKGRVGYKANTQEKGTTFFIELPAVSTK